MARNKKDKKEEETEAGAPSWMVTYGDLMSLLLTFFVLIVSMSSIQIVKFEKAMGSLQGALGVLTADPTVIAHPEVYKSDLTGFQPRRVVSALNEMQQFIKENKLEDSIHIQAQGDEIAIRISNPVLFDLGKANLKPDIFPMLLHIVKLGEGSSIRVEGHTDDLPIKTPQFPSNWELSAARASTVIRYFVDEGGLEPAKLSASGYAEFRPIKPNDSAKGRGSNRRVEIFVKYRGEEKIVPSGLHGTEPDSAFAEFLQAMDADNE